MSRVHSDQKFVNMPKHDSSVTGPSKMVRIHCEGEDYHKAETLSSWLFMKYDMSYKTYSRKSKNRRAELRKEYMQDTSNRDPKNIALPNDDFDEADAMALLAEIGVPFSPDGTPIGIGWDD